MGARLFLGPPPPTSLALLDRGADPTVLNRKKQSPLMYQSIFGSYECVARLLQDQRVLATINAQDENGNTALHEASLRNEKVRLLLQAGANPAIKNRRRQTPLARLREKHEEDPGRVWSTRYYTTIALLEEYPVAKKDAEKASLLVKARLAVAATAASTTNTVPSCLHGRVAAGHPLPAVVQPPCGAKTRQRRFGRVVAFVVGMEGGSGMPRDVFRGVFMNFLMPSWDPLRRKWGIAQGCVGL